MTAPCQLGTPILAASEWACPAVFCVLFAGLVAIAIFVTNQRLEQKGQVFEKLESMGFHVIASPTDVQKFDAYSMLGRPLTDGLHGVTWIARGRVSGLQTFVIQHVVCMKHHGRRGASLITRMFAATSCPAGWPRLELTEMNLGDELLGLVGVRRTEHPSGSSEFGKRWRVSCDDPDFANLVLSARVTDLALSLPGNSGVLIGGGHIVVSLKEYVRPDEAVRLASLPAEFLSLLSPEVSVYQSPIRA
ncbi:MAG: hypothetical protein IT432_11315 [Phycisphaerales bacterium]|nr:hypothetical protein [Phycisphaerales bacterium]